MPPHFRRWVHRLMRKAQAGHGPCPAGATASGQTAGAEPNSGSQQQEETSTNNAYDEYLRNIGADIAQFLDPFGGCMVENYFASFSSIETQVVQLHGFTDVVSAAHLKWCDLKKRNVPP